MNIRSSSTMKVGNMAAVLEAVTLRATLAMRESAEIVANTARAFAPVDTGELRGSIGFQVALIGMLVEGLVFANARHASFIEYGTGLVGRASPHGALPQTGVPFTGSWIYDWRGRGWIGMPARPYIRPALDVSGPAILNAFRQQGFKV